MRNKELTLFVKENVLQVIHRNRLQYVYQLKLLYLNC